MDDDTEKRLRELLDYLKRWNAVHTAWLAWIDAEYQARLGGWLKYRKQARAKLAAAIDNLPVDRSGRATPTYQQKRAFKLLTQKLLSGVVLRGQELFGVRIDRDPAGLAIGTLDDAMNTKVQAALKKVFSDSA